MSRIQGQLAEITRRLSDLERQDRSHRFCIGLLKAGPSKFEAYDDDGRTQFTGTATTIPLNATRIDIGGDMVLADNEVTIQRDGLYEIGMPTMVATASGSGAFAAEAWLEKNSSEVSQTRVALGAPA